MKRDSMKPLTVRFPPDLLDRLTRQTGKEKAATGKQASRNDLIIRLLAEGMARLEDGG